MVALIRAFDVSREESSKWYNALDRHDPDTLATIFEGDKPSHAIVYVIS